MGWLMLHEKLPLTLAAWFGILFLPALFGSLWLPNLVERIRRPRARRARRAWRPVRRVSLLAALVAELAVRAAFWLTAKVLRLDRTGAQR
jgi:hypothetical protein